MGSYTLHSPLQICYDKTKKGREYFFRLNLNTYKGVRIYVLNASKVAYGLLMQPQVQQLPVFTKPVHIHYKLFVGTARKTDIMNWVAVIDKFFQDVLVNEGKLLDDNYDYVPYITCSFGGIDKNNPRMEITIEDQIT